MTTGSAWTRRAAGALVALLAAVLAVLGTAGTASAHGALDSTDPAQGSVVARQPSAVTLTFGEGVTLPAEALRVFDPAGGRVDTGTPDHAGGKAETARIALRGGLADGTYTVAWRVVSADSHPIGGAFTFSVGAPSASAVSAESLQGSTDTDGLIGFLYGAARLAAYAAFALLAGAVAFVLLCWPAGAAARSVQRLLVAGWVALLGSTVVLMMLRGAYEQGGGIAPPADPATAPAHVDLDERIYLVLAARLLLLVVSGVFLVLLVGQSGQPDPEQPERSQARSRTRLRLAGLALAVGLSATWAVTNHSSEGAQVWLAVPVTALHLLAMAAWLGGLATLLSGLRDDLPATAVERFSRLAFVSVTVLVLTGLYRSWREVGSWDALFSTGYGRLLLVKVGLVALMVAAAWVSRSRLARLRTTAGTPVHAAVTAGAPAPDPVEPPQAPPARAALRRSVLAEAAVAVAVLVVTTLLTATSPGRNANAATATAPGPAATAANRAPARTTTVRIPYDTGGTTPSARGTATVELVPAKAGGYAVRVILRDPAGKPAEVPEARLAFSLPARDLGPLQVALRSDGAGRWTGTVPLALAGEWKALLTVRSSDIDMATSTRSFPLGQS
ncbi:copper resistance CopC/CopD family protein [Streptomyces lichenis]|uniref:FixH family protein n=1 Tax=Streptomyces lichenis TaxID=2306967 RepID=A0ABT0I3Y0_9ACTN|nr:copper resistance protein CopC [Streptomyces lichenis]MCK8675987.1 FixH family protein [Streptomyces lichenis]